MLGYVPVLNINKHTRTLFVLDGILIPDDWMRSFAFAQI